MSSTKIIPEVLWAQRSSSKEPEKNIVYLTFNVADLQNPKVDITSSSVSLKGSDVSGSKEVDITLELFDEIDEKQCKISPNARDIFLVLRKKKHVDEYWPRLTSGTKKEHFIKTDFDKWVDQEEQDGEPDDLSRYDGGMDFSNMDFSSMGGGGGAGDSDSDSGAEGENDDHAEEDNGPDDEAMPELETEQK